MQLKQYKQLDFVTMLIIIYCSIQQYKAVPVNHWVRIRTLDNENNFGKNASWKYNNSVTAEFILSLIDDLKPNVLERYFCGEFDINASIIPTSNSNVNMTAIEFLQKSLNGCHEKQCIMTPRLSLQQYSSSPYAMYQTSQFYYDLPLNPPLRILSLDNWEQFNQDVNYNETLIEQVLDGFTKQGWQYIAVNDCGGYYNSQNEAQIFEFPISPNENFTPNYNIYDHINEYEANITRIVSYIDFPGPMQKFANLTGDQQAEILQNIASDSVTPNRTFINVWNIIQGFWDSTKVFTSKQNIKWKGQSIYNVSKTLMQSYG